MTFRCPSCLTHLDLDQLPPEEVIRKWDQYSINIDLNTLSFPDGGQVQFPHGLALYMLCFVRANGRVCSREFIHEYVYGNKPECDQPELKIVDVQICKLRKCLGLYKNILRTNWALGYSLRTWDAFLPVKDKSFTPSMHRE